jgi:hypothetical protein
MVQFEDAHQVGADLDEHPFPKARGLYERHDVWLYILAIVAHMVWAGPTVLR